MIFHRMWIDTIRFYSKTIEKEHNIVIVNRFTNGWIYFYLNHERLTKIHRQQFERSVPVLAFCAIRSPSSPADRFDAVPALAMIHNHQHEYLDCSRQAPL